MMCDGKPHTCTRPQEGSAPCIISSIRHCRMQRQLSIKKKEKNDPLDVIFTTTHDARLRRLLLLLLLLLPKHCNHLKIYVFQSSVGFSLSRCCCSHPAHTTPRRSPPHARFFLFSLVGFLLLFANASHFLHSHPQSLSHHNHHPHLKMHHTIDTRSPLMMARSCSTSNIAASRASCMLMSNAALRSLSLVTSSASRAFPECRVNIQSHSFIRSFVRSFVHSFIRSFIHSFIRSS